MGHRLAHGVEHEADPHAGREQHGDPGGELEVGSGFVRSELQPAVAAQAEEQHSGEEDADGEEIEPAEGIENASLQGPEDLAGAIGENHPDGEEDADDGDGAVKDRRVDDEALEHVAPLDAPSPAAACTGAGIASFRNARVPHPG